MGELTIARERFEQSLALYRPERHDSQIAQYGTDLGVAGHCYAWPERYRTNNALETFFGRLRTRQRQTNGHKSTHDFILRYGEWAVFVDPQESLEQVLKRIQRFKQREFDQEYVRFQKTQQQLQVLYRFRHKPRSCLAALEQEWAEAVHRKSRKSQRG